MAIEEQALNSLTFLMGQYITSLENIEIENIKQQAMTDRLREQETGKTDRLRIQEQAKVIHHSIESEERKYINALEKDHTIKMELMASLNEILKKIGELSSNETMICEIIIKNITQPGTNVEQLKSLKDAHYKLMKLQTENDCLIE